MDYMTLNARLLALASKVKAQQDKRRADQEAFEQQLAALREASRKFTDTEFPTELSSLITGVKSSHPEIAKLQKLSSKVIWIRATQISSLNPMVKQVDGSRKKEKVKLFAGSIEPNDILQGVLGDCYLLSSLSVLAEHPERVKRLFSTEQANDQGFYQIQSYVNGLCQTVTVDDFIPCSEKDGRPMFSRAQGPELWVILLEKAWAKIHGSYERIIWGHAHFALRDLTGAPSFEIDASSPDAFDLILEGERRNYVMAAGCDGSDPEKKEVFEEVGLVSEHSYGIISVAEVTDKDGQPVKLVKLRNPWGSFEWQGDWSDESDCWTEELKEQLELKADSTDGTFWISFDDMIQFFERIQICKYVDNHKFNGIKIVQAQDAEWALASAEVKTAGDYTFAMSQVSDRLFPRNSAYKYSNTRFILFRQTKGGSITFVASATGVGDRDTYIEAGSIEAGTYLLYADTDWLWQGREFSFSAYGQDEVALKEPENFPLSRHELLLRGFLSRAEAKDESQHDDIEISKFEAKGTPNLRRIISNSSPDCYHYILISNREAASTYTERGTFSTLQGAQILTDNGVSRSNSYFLEVSPGEDKAVIVRYDFSGHQVQMTYKNEVSFSDEGMADRCYSEGQSQPRDAGITQRVYQCDSGVSIHYENTSESRTLQEQLEVSWQNLQVGTVSSEQMFSVAHPTADTLSVRISVGPGQKGHLILRAIEWGLPWKFQQTYSFQLMEDQ